MFQSVHDRIKVESDHSQEKVTKCCKRHQEGLWISFTNADQLHAETPISFLRKIKIPVTKIWITDS
jgi:hypothetical protein